MAIHKHSFQAPKNSLDFSTREHRLIGYQTAPEEPQENADASTTDKSMNTLAKGQEDMRKQIEQLQKNVQAAPSTPTTTSEQTKIPGSPDYWDMPTLNIQHITDGIRGSLVALMPVTTASLAFAGGMGAVPLGKITGKNWTMRQGAGLAIPNPKRALKSTWEVLKFLPHSVLSTGVNIGKWFNYKIGRPSVGAAFNAIVGKEGAEQKQPGVIRTGINAVRDTTKNFIQMLPAIPRAAADMILKAPEMIKNNPLKSTIAGLVLADFITQGGATSMAILESITKTLGWFVK